jgi:hypothetical protein
MEKVSPIAHPTHIQGELRESPPSRRMVTDCAHAHACACAVVSAATWAQQKAAADGEPCVSSDVTRIVITAPAIGSQSSRSLLTSVDSIGSGAVQVASVAANHRWR